MIASLAGATALVLSAAITAGVKIYTLSTENKKAIRELTFQEAALSFEDFIVEWDAIHRDLTDLFATTNINRFLILRAWNGYSDPKWTTAFFQMRDGDYKPISYVHFDLDQDYIDRLNLIINRGYSVFTTDSMPDSKVKLVYTMEGIKHTVWFFIAKKFLDKDKDVAAITYCSFATQNDVELTDNEIAKCMLIVNRLRGITVADDSVALLKRTK